MCRMRVGNVLITTLCIVWIVISGTSSSYGDLVDKKVLNVGEELWRETMPLRIGSRFYWLQGIKPSTWYEVKISYLGSIPASFTIQLKSGDLELPLNGNRRLLNTEKLIFNSEKHDWNGKGSLYVLVTVEPEGVVAIPNVQERKDIIFNIVARFGGPKSYRYGKQFAMNYRWAFLTKLGGLLALWWCVWFCPLSYPHFFHPSC